MYAQGKSIDNIYIVRERDRQRFRELFAVLALGIPVGLFLLLFTWQNIEVIRLGREATRLQSELVRLEEENRKLVLEIESQTALQRIEHDATSIGLRPVAGDNLVVVVEGRGASDEPPRTTGKDSR